MVPAELFHDAKSARPMSSAADPNVRAPSSRETLALVVVSFVVFVCFISATQNYFGLVDGFGDSAGYMKLASSIRRWDFHGIVVKQFWGLPYAMAGLSALTRLSDRTALLLCCFIPSLLTTLLARTLWDGWIAAYFAILNFDWLQRSCLGGSEPLFVCLLFGAFLAARRGRWLLASLLASLATIVRPMGLFALVGIGVSLLWKRRWRSFAAATAIGLLVGGLYTIPLSMQFGDPLATVHSYHNHAWSGGWVFGFPFYAIVKGTLLYQSPVTNLALTFGWISLVLVAVIVMARSAEFRGYCRSHLVEAFFLIPYLWCIFSYNYPYWARGNFVRFAIPIVPFVLLALRRWIPKDRRVLWILAFASPLLAASSALGVENVVHRLRQMLL